MTSHGHDHTEPHVAVLPSYRGLPLTAAQRKRWRPRWSSCWQFSSAGCSSCFRRTGT